VRVVHLSTIHTPFDVRIFYKECRTLAAAGHEVHYLVNDPPVACRDGVTFHHCERPTGWRPLRIGRRLTRVYRRARELAGDVYHFHDPELITVGLMLRRSGARVIYDVHENAVQEAFTLNRDRPWHGRVKSWGWKLLEGLARHRLDAFVCATPAIALVFPPERTITVQNFPLREEFRASSGTQALAYDQRPRKAVFVGGITSFRGAREMVTALEHFESGEGGRLLLVGEVLPAALLSQLQILPGWRRVDAVGMQPRQLVPGLLSEARVGLVLYHPTPDHLEAQPNKLFEYLAAGLPVVASDFPLWRSIVASAGCGLVVDPLDPAAIAEAVRWLFDHPAEAQAMGQRGQAVVAQKYTWEAEGRKLVELYHHLEKPPRPLAA
jgi:glycosyltransferase involved in cell wall biosynthesis